MSDYWSEEIISEYIDGRLSESECEQVEAYLKEHPQDAEVASELAQLRNEFRDAPRYRLDDNFSSRVTRLIEQKNQVTTDSLDSPVVPSIVGVTQERSKEESFAPRGRSASWKSAAAMIATLAASLLIVLFVVPPPKAPVAGVALTSKDLRKESVVVSPGDKDKDFGPEGSDKTRDPEAAKKLGNARLQEKAGGLESLRQPSARSGIEEAPPANEVSRGMESGSVAQAADAQESDQAFDRKTDRKAGRKAIPGDAGRNQPAPAIPSRDMERERLDSSSAAPTADLPFSQRMGESARRRDTKNADGQVKDESSPQTKKLFETETSETGQFKAVDDRVADVEPLELAEGLEATDRFKESDSESGGESYRFSYDEVVVVRNHVSREKIAALQKVALYPATDSLEQFAMDEEHDGEVDADDAREANDDKVMDGLEGESGNQFQYATPPFGDNARDSDPGFRAEVTADEVLLKELAERNARKNELADAGKYMIDDVAMFTVEATEEEFANLMAHLGGETISMDESGVRLSMVESIDTLNQEFDGGDAGGGRGGGGGAGAGADDERIADAPGESAGESAVEPAAPTGAVLQPMQGYRQSPDKLDLYQLNRQSGGKERKGRDRDDKKDGGQGLSDRPKSDESWSKPGARRRSGASTMETGDLESQPQPPLRRRYLLVIRFQPDAETEAESAPASDR